MCVWKAKTAFTLSEVLITLLVIGVIAALTIPALITSNQNSALRSASKKIYSDLSAATRMIIQNQGGGLAGLCDTDDNDCVRELYATYLSYVRKCNMGTDTLEGNCWTTANKLYFFNGTSFGIEQGDWDDGDSGMVLSNGVFLDFYWWARDCTDDYSYNEDGSLLMCGQLYADLNGYKGPNKIGRDILEFIVGQNEIRVSGTDKDWNYEDCGSGTTGWGCAAWTLKEIDY